MNEARVRWEENDSGALVRDEERLGQRWVVMADADYVNALEDKLRIAEAVRYLPLECPVCGRMRLEYWPAENKLVCEKCGADNDVLADKDNWDKLRIAVEGLREIEAQAGMSVAIGGPPSLIAERILREIGEA